MSKRPCITCGEPTEGSYCTDHQPATHQLSADARGYDAAWRRLSKRARRLQPWCTDCGTTEDLTGDHLRWPARQLEDVDVVCRTCNSRRGAIRGDRPTHPQGTRPQQPPATTVRPAVKPVTHRRRAL